MFVCLFWSNWIWIVHLRLYNRDIYCKIVQSVIEFYSKNTRNTSARIKVKMKILQVTKSYSYLMGLDTHDGHSSENPVRKYFRKLFLVLMIFSLFVLSTWFFCFEAETLNDFTISLCFSLCMFLHVIWWIILAWQQRNFKDLINDLQAKVNESKNQKHYNLPTFS